MGDLREQIRDCLHGRVCLMGIGNVEQGDGGTGVRLAEELLDRGVSGVVVAGSAPERAVEFITGVFDHILFIDAVDFGSTPGSCALMNARQMIARFAKNGAEVSLGTLAKLVEASRATKAWLLAIQPGSLAAGNQLTPALQEATEELAALLQAATATDHDPVPVMA